MQSVSNHSVSHSGNLSISNNEFENLKISGNCNLSNITCTGPLVCSGSARIENSNLNIVKASGNIELHNCMTDQVFSSGHFYALNCAKLGAVNTSGQTHLINCKNVSGILASGSLSLLNTYVSGNVIHLGIDVEINQSTIAGKLECLDRKIKIHNSTADEIVVRRNPNSYSFECFGIFKFNKEAFTSPEYVIELIGKQCVINSISFENGCVGKVILKDGAKVTGKVIRGSIQVE